MDDDMRNQLFLALLNRRDYLTQKVNDNGGFENANNYWLRPLASAEMTIDHFTNTYYPNNCPLPA